MNIKKALTLNALLGVFLWANVNAATPVLSQCTNLTPTVSCDTANNANCCGPDLTDQMAGANLGSTQVDGEVTTDRAGGNMKSCLYTGSTAPTKAQIDAGSAPCVSGTNKTKSVSSAGKISFTGGDAFTGLSASTEYRKAAYHNSGTDRPRFKIVTTAPFTTHAGGGGGGSDITGSVYVVSDSGSDSNNGLDDSTPWRTLAKVNNDVTAAGSDVCLLAGSVFEDQTIRPDWGGTSSDPAIVATCYENAGALYWWWDGPQAYSTTRAEINGTWEPACADANPVSCTVNTSGAVPSGFSGALVTVTASYTHIRGLKVHDSAGDGIVSGGQYTGVEIAQNDLERIMFVAIKQGSGNKEFITADNTVFRATDCELAEGQNRMGGQIWKNCGKNGKPPCIAAQHNNPANGGWPYGAIIGNKVTQSACEGVNLWNSGRVYVAFNTISNTGAGVYMDTSGGNWVDRNLVIGNPDNANRIHDKAAQGIGWSMENYSGRYDVPDSQAMNLATRNIIVNGASGLWANSFASGSATLHRSAQFGYFNTVVATSAYSVVQNGGGYDTIMLDSELAGNIFYSPNASSANAGCSMRDVGQPFDNLYPSNPTDSSCDGTGDVYDDPGFGETISNLEDWDYTDIPTLDITDLTPSGSSASLEQVSAITYPSKVTTLIGESGWSDITARVQYYKGEMQNRDFWSSCTGAIPSEIETTDAFCASRGSAPYDMGAIER